jgi:molybdate transport system substrate-binding protein
MDLFYIYTIYKINSFLFLNKYGILYKRRGLIMNRIFILISILFTFGCVKENNIVTVSVASSMVNLMEEIKKDFEKRYEIKIELNVASSGSLRNQILQGAPVDIFISANEKYANEIIEKQIGNNKINFLTNRLVLIKNNKIKEKIDNFQELKNIEKIAIGIPELVPAGMYAKEFFEKIKIYEILKSKIIFTKNVRQVLNYVEMGEVDYGIVYYSDTINLKNSKIIMEIPKEYYSKIVYPIVIINNNKNSEIFVKYLMNELGNEIIQKYRFSRYDRK